MSSPALLLSSPSTQPAREVSDLEAVSAVVGGDREMFAVIVRRYNPQLYRVGMAYLRDHAQTEDAMQETYLKAFLHLDRFQGTSAFSTWLTRIMINQCLMIIRRQKRHPAEALDESRANAEADATEPPTLDGLDAAEIRALIERSVAALPRSHRAVYLLREVQQLSTEDTARCLGMTAGNVKVTLHRAREGLKQQLLKTSEGIELFDYSARYCDPMTTRVMAAIRALPR